MSAKKVRRHIRRLQRERRRAQRRGIGRVPQSDAGPTPDPGTTSDAGTTPDAGVRRGGGARAGAVLAVVAVVAVAGGSIARDATDAAPGTRPVDAKLFPTAAADTPFVCPPTPGRPDTLSSDGRVAYQQRDASASSLFRGLVFAVDDAGSLPEVRWAQLSEDQRVNEESVVAPSGAPAEASSAPALADREATVVTEDDPLRAPLLDVGPGPGGAPIAASALLEYSAADGPVSGLAAARCTVPQRDQFFLGPETGSQATSLLTLANPADRDATVEVVAHDAEGPRSGAGTRSVVVPAGTLRTVNIAGLAEDGAIAVSVESSGAPVAAQLTSSAAAGSIGAGVEFLPGRTQAVEEHRMPGVRLPESGGAAGGGALWIHVPGDDEATVEVQVFGEDGLEPLDGSSVFSVDGGAVRAIDLAGVPAGTHDVVVRTSVPTHAAVRTVSDVEAGGGADGDAGGEDAAASGLDFAWQVGAERLRSGSGTLLPAEGEPSVHLLAGDQATTVTYRLMDAEGDFGEPQEVEVRADGSAALDPEDLQLSDGDAAGEQAAAIVVEEPDAPVVGSLRIAGEEGQSMTGLEPLGEAHQAVRVRLRD
ncbi:DUF5719 family protein [Nesterenkonia sp. F]|uniref:DUF5719 family protein n=1 Tax=Nesterenkonia sp. F TaxID=795955 RepID=UPI000255D76A|nr:DUF5719 family protein [Nesterenkonia sp. F]